MKAVLVLLLFITAVFSQGRKPRPFVPDVEPTIE